MTGASRPSGDHNQHLTSLQLSMYVDDETPLDQRHEVEAHLAACPACAAKLDSLRSIAVTISALPRTTPSAGVFDNVLAGVRRVDDAATGVAREGLGRRRAHGPVRLREVRLPDFDAPASAARRRRPNWRAPFGVAFPTIAALLLLAFTAGLLVRASLTSSAPLINGNPTATIPPGDTLKATQNAIANAAGRLRFTPVVPTYLPSGARLDSVSLHTHAGGITALDVIWVMTAGPLRSLHLREQPAAAPINDYETQSLMAPGLAWQVGQSPVWRQMTQVEGKGWVGVSQVHGDVALLLDAESAPGASTSEVAQSLRFTSLSLDTAYRLPGVAIGAPATGSLLRAIATVNGAGQTWTWDLTTSLDPLATYRRSTITHSNGAAETVNVTEITYAGAGVLRDNIHRVYQSVPGPTPSNQPPSSASQIAFDANTNLAQGKLWNLGLINVMIPGLGVRHVYDLYRVDTMRPEHVYADATTGAVLAIFVDTTTTLSPGGDGSLQPYVTTAVCQPYTVSYQWLVYEPSNQAAATFDTKPPSNYQPGAVALPFTCG